MALKTFHKDEPVLFAGAIQAVVGVLMAFGVGLSTTQVGALMALLAAIGAFFARKAVAPVDSP